MCVWNLTLKQHNPEDYKKSESQKRIEKIFEEDLKEAKKEAKSLSGSL